MTQVSLLAWMLLGDNPHLKFLRKNSDLLPHISKLGMAGLMFNNQPWICVPTPTTYQWWQCLVVWYCACTKEKISVGCHSVCLWWMESNWVQYIPLKGPAWAFVWYLILAAWTGAVALCWSCSPKKTAKIYFSSTEAYWFTLRWLAIPVSSKQPCNMSF